ncbi:MAG: hypothetical protein RLY70_3027 [Planctomycetota bacterium]|jgi:flagellar biosynthesis protein FliR
MNVFSVSESASMAAPVGMLLALRIGAAVFLAPGLGGRALPGRLRAVLTLLLAFSVAPALWPQLLISQTDGWSAVWRLGPREVAIGLLLGLTVRLLVTGAACAGQLLGEMAGGAGNFGESADSDGTGQLGALARLMEWTAIAVFLLAGGHRQLVEGIMESYRSWPLALSDSAHGIGSQGEQVWFSIPGTAGGGLAPLAESLVAALTRGSLLAVRTAFPALIAAGTTTLAAGLLSRVLPQMETQTWMAALIWFVVLGSIALGIASLGAMLPMEIERLRRSPSASVADPPNSAGGSTAAFGMGGTQ